MDTSAKRDERAPIMMRFAFFVFLLVVSVLASFGFGVEVGRPIQASVGFFLLFFAVPLGGFAIAFFLPPCIAQEFFGESDVNYE